MDDGSKVVGFVGSITSLEDLVSQTTSRITELTDESLNVSTLFSTFPAYLPVLASSLRSLKCRAETSQPPVDVINSLQALINSLSSHFTVLETYLTQNTRSPRVCTPQRETNALESVLKETDVQAAVERIQRDIDLLVPYQTTRSSDLRDHISREGSQWHQASIQISTVRHGHDIGNVTAYDQSAIHVGDVYNIGYQRPVEVQSLGLCLGSAPLIGPDSFVGRATEISIMHDILRANEAFVGQQRLILGGLGGVGKTQLAIAYSRRYSHEYSSVVWLNATSSSTLVTSFQSVARSLLKAAELANLGSEQMSTRVHEWLCQARNAGWLLIFDNYDEPNLFNIDDFCPNVGHGCIIITTRLPDQVTGEQVRVEPLKDIGESLRVLQVRSGRDNVGSDSDARKLAERLGGFPLALATAGAYLRRSTVTFGQYLDIYEQRWKVDPRKTLQLHEYQDRTMYTTWNLSYARLQKIDPAAASMLKLLAYFDNQDIWYELLQAGTADDLPVWLQESVTDRFSFESVMGTLVEFCFVETQSETSSYSLHNCVHDWTLGELNKVIDSQLYWYATSCVVAEMNRSAPSLFVQFRSTRVLRHALRQVHPRFVRDLLTDVVETDRLQIICELAWLLKGQGQLHAAEQMFLRALSGTEKTRGSDHKDIRRILYHLAITYQNMGEPVEAEKLYRQVLMGRLEISEPYDDLALQTLRRLGVLYQDQGKLEQAKFLFEQVLCILEQALGSDNPEVLKVVVALGKIHYDQGKLEDAMKMYTRAYDAYEKTISMGTAPTSMVKVFARTISHIMCMLEPGSADAHHMLALLIRLAIDEGQKACFFLGRLGTALLLQNDDTNAQTAFQYSIRRFNESASDFSGAYCDGCLRSLSLETGRYVCRQCPDTDLCDHCMRKYRRLELKVAGCSKHNYFTVDTRHPLLTKPLTKWLSELGAAYGVIGSDQRQ